MALPLRAGDNSPVANDAHERNGHHGPGESRKEEESRSDEEQPFFATVMLFWNTQEEGPFLPPPFFDSGIVINQNLGRMFHTSQPTNSIKGRE